MMQEENVNNLGDQVNAEHPVNQRMQEENREGEDLITPEEREREILQRMRHAYTSFRVRLKEDQQTFLAIIRKIRSRFITDFDAIGNLNQRVQNHHSVLKQVIRFFFNKLNARSQILRYADFC